MGRAEGVLELFKEPGMKWVLAIGTFGIYLFALIFNLFTYSFTLLFAGFSFIYILTIVVAIILSLISVNEFYENNGHGGVKVGQGVGFLIIAYVVLAFGLSIAYNYMNFLSLWWIEILNSWIYLIVIYVIAIVMVVIVWA